MTATAIMRANPANWPEVADGHVAPLVCDFCHASLDEIAQRGHYGNCDCPAVHNHPVDQLIDDCTWWRVYSTANAAAAEAPHRLYRFFGELGVLIYIGITDDLATRWNSHRRQKSWWLDVRGMTATPYPTREALEAAEIEAIRTEKPLHNVVHNRPATTVPMQRPARPLQVTARPADALSRFGKVVAKRSLTPRFDRWTYPKTPAFGQWLLDQAYRGDDIGEMATELRYRTDALSLSPMPVSDIRRRLYDAKAAKWECDALDDAEHEYVDRCAELDSSPSLTTIELHVDRGETFPRKIHVERDVAAHVQLDRDNYYETIHGPRSISTKFREAASECAKAGCGRIWADRLWLSRGLDVAASDRWVNLYVPLGLIDAAMTALYEADVRDNLRPLRALTEELS